MDATTVALDSARKPGWHAPRDFRDRRVHMVGIGGSGMSGLAAVLLHRGALISGTDREPDNIPRRLRTGGAVIMPAGDAAAIPPETELLVVSAAIKPDHEEYVEAARRSIPIVKYAQLLGALMEQRDGIAVSGAHGKSTTSAWLAHVLCQADLDPTFVIGAIVEQLGGGSAAGDGPHFVAEACEYDRSFHNLRPRAACVLNIDQDHLDCYKNLDEITESFAHFASLLPDDGLLVLNGDDERCLSLRNRTQAVVETFGFGLDNDWRATDLCEQGGCYEWTLEFRGETVRRMQTGIAGRHNVLNALAVIALARRARVHWDTLATALRSFRGAKRRLDHVGTVDGVVVIDDYAHHPTEIGVTLEALRTQYAPRRLWCVFQPHQHSRTRLLMNEFAGSFSTADRVLVPRIYSVRDTQTDRDGVGAAHLVEKICATGQHAAHLPEFVAILDTLAEKVEPGDLVVTMGAGDIWKVSHELVRRLRTERSR